MTSDVMIKNSAAPKVAVIDRKDSMFMSASEILSVHFNGSQDIKPRHIEAMSTTVSQLFLDLWPPIYKVLVEKDIDLSEMERAEEMILSVAWNDVVSLVTNRTVRVVMKGEGQ